MLKIDILTNENTYLFHFIGVVIVVSVKAWKIECFTIAIYLNKKSTIFIRVFILLNIVKLNWILYNSKS